MDVWAKDAALTIRNFRRYPIFSTIAILTLALGIGATTAVYGVVNAVLLNPLPYRDANRLVRIVDNVPADESVSGLPERTTEMTQDAFLWWRDQSKTLTGMAAYVAAAMTSVKGSETVRLAGARVSPSLFAILDVAPAAGRPLIAADEEAPNVAVISARLAASFFEGDAPVIGRTLRLDGVTHTVVGMMPAGFEFPSAQTDVWVPYAVKPDSATRVLRLNVIARLKDEVTVSAAAQETNVIGSSFVGLPAPGEPDAPTSPRFEVIGVQDHLVAPVRPALRAVSVAVALLLAIACANVANLVMSRNAGRRAEMQIRRALGAGRRRLMAQLITEGLLLSAAGGMAGIGIAWCALTLVKTLTTVDRPALYGGTGTLLPGVEHARLLDGGVLAFAFGLCVLTGLAFSVVPAWRMSGGSGRRGRTRSALNVIELALATILLIGAGLLTRSFVRLANVDNGYNPAHTLTFEMVVPQPFADDRKLSLAMNLETQLRSIPGVRATGFTGGAPLSAWREGWGVSRTPPQPGSGLDRRLFAADARRVSPGYLRAIGARLVEGRWLEPSDASVQPHVLLINRALSRQLFGNQSPLGRRIYIGPIPWEIAGVVADMRGEAVDAEPQAEAYVDPVAMQAIARSERWADFPTAPDFLSFAIRFSGDPAVVIRAARHRLQQLEPAAALDGVVGMDAIVSSAMARQRFLATLPTLFALIAAALAALGVYGVLAHGVASRTREIGTRLALGATPLRVLGMVLSEAGIMTAAGIGIGLASAVPLAHPMAGLLYGIQPFDVATFLAVPVGFTLIAMLAAFVPARQATRVQPMTALRHE